MNLDSYVLRNDDPISDKVLEFYSFLLRYHQQIDHSDFSENQVVLQRLKRYEDLKCWNELEELAVAQEKFDKYIKEWANIPRAGPQPPAEKARVEIPSDYLSK